MVNEFASNNFRYVRFNGIKSVIDSEWDFYLTVCMDCTVCFRFRTIRKSSTWSLRIQKCLLYSAKKICTRENVFDASRCAWRIDILSLVLTFNTYMKKSRLICSFSIKVPCGHPTQRRLLERRMYNGCLVSYTTSDDKPRILSRILGRFVPLTPNSNGARARIA